MLAQEPSMRKIIFPALLLVSLTAIAAEQVDRSSLRIEKVMTKQELDETGVSGLTKAQRSALDAWLDRYTRRVLDFGARATLEKQTTATIESKCDPAIESTISGETEGWSGETIFKLDNGQIWEQAEYSYNYFYAYRPDVTIYHSQSGCRMKVEDEEETILVRRIK
jgi:hypothetical protein